MAQLKTAQVTNNMSNNLQENKRQIRGAKKFFCGR